MKNKKCEIISDLLPSYIDHLTSEKSNEMIEEHLRTCKLCKEKIRNMSTELKLEEIKQKELDYLKKYNRSRRNSILLGILLGTFIILIWYFGTAFYRFHILHTLNSQFQEARKKNNIYVEVLYADLKDNIVDNIVDDVGITKYWYKDGVVKWTSEDAKDTIKSNSTKFVYFTDFKNQIEYRMNLKDNSILTEKVSALVNTNILDVLIGIFYPDNLNTLRYSFDFCSAHIYQTKQLYGRSYYICDYGDEIEIFDKSSKLLQYRLQYMGDRMQLQTYKYEFGSVTDEDVTLPNF